MTNKEENRKIKIVIDTDIGTDCDDLFALAYLLKNPNAEVIGITTVHGNTEIRAKIVKKLEKILNVNISITAGFSGSDEMVKKYWTGIEEKALTSEELNEKFQNSGFPIYDSETKLICIGPLTNIAYQIENNPSIGNIKEIYIMGTDEHSYNFEADLNAMNIVLSQKWKIYKITKEVSNNIFFERNELDAFRESEVGSFLYKSAANWLDFTAREKTVMYDVLTVSAALNEGYVYFFGDKKLQVSDYVSPKLKERILEVIRK